MASIVDQLVSCLTLNRLTTLRSRNTGIKSLLAMMIPIGQKKNPSINIVPNVYISVGSDMMFSDDTKLQQLIKTTCIIILKSAPSCEIFQLIK